VAHGGARVAHVVQRVEAADEVEAAPVVLRHAGRLEGHVGHARRRGSLARGRDRPGVAGREEPLGALEHEIGTGRSGSASAAACSSVMPKRPSAQVT
jgi:hypothetical protein